MCNILARPSVRLDVIVCPRILIPIKTSTHHNFISFPTPEFHLTCSFIYRASSRLHLLDTSRLHLLDTCSTLARLLIARSSSLYVIRIYLLHDYMCFALRGLYLIHPALSQNNWLQAEF